METPITPNIIEPPVTLPPVNEGLGKVMDDAKFRLSGKKVFLTYVGHIGARCIEVLHNYSEIKQWIYAHEVGDTGYMHTHVMVEFIKKLSSTNSRVFDVDHVHPNIATVRSWIASTRYIMKGGEYVSSFDTKNAIGMPALIDKITSQKNVIEAVKECATSLRDVIPIIQVYNNKTLLMDNRLCMFLESLSFLPWQEDLYSYIDGCPDRRRIHWVYEEIGNTGKTTFCDIVEYKRKGECLVLAGTGSMRDIGDVIRNWIETGNDPKIILIDLPRTLEERDSIYTILESIKNGRLTCTKYKGATLRFYPPNVVVFSNWAPNLTKMSQDRWMIHTLKDDKHGHRLVTL